MKQIFGICGSLILIIGVFAPVISLPSIGILDYFRGGSADGIVIMVLGGISLLLTLSRVYRGLWFTGLSALVVIVFTLSNFHTVALEKFPHTEPQWDSGGIVLFVGVASLFLAAGLRLGGENGNWS
jgi:hypothetical protein